MTDQKLIDIEKKYYDIILDTLCKNLGRIITDINSQHRFKIITMNAKTNPIESKAENTIENIIANQLHWDVCSLPVSSDSCYSCGDAIVHIDVKTTHINDDDAPSKKNRINIESAQTSYIHGQTISVVTPWSGVGKKPTPANWTCKLKQYEKHEDFGIIPNLTYFVRIIYSDANLVEEMSLICVPNGQLAPLFGNADIFNGGKTKSNDKKNWSNIRVLLSKITDHSDNNWRNTIIYKRQS